MHELRSFSAQVVKESALPIIGVLIDDAGVESMPQLVRRCGFLYRVRKDTKSNIIACNLDLIAMENIAFALNMSLELIQYDQVLHYKLVTFRMKHYFTVAVLQIFGLIDSPYTDFTSSFSSPVVIDLQQSHFLYCVKSDQIENFDFMFWTVPMDSWTWTLLGIS